MDKKKAAIQAKTTKKFLTKTRVSRRSITGLSFLPTKVQFGP